MFTKVEILAQPATIGFKLALEMRLADSDGLRNLQIKNFGCETLKIDYRRRAHPAYGIFPGVEGHPQVFPGDL